MPKLSIEDLVERFPFFRVAFVFAEPLAIAPHRSIALAEEAAAAEEDCRRHWGGVELSAFPKSRPGARRTKASASSGRAIDHRSSA
jgi:hypothetical protein